MYYTFLEKWSKGQLPQRRISHPVISYRTAGPMIRVEEPPLSEGIVLDNEGQSLPIELPEGSPDSSLLNYLAGRRQTVAEAVVLDNDKQRLALLSQAVGQRHDNCDEDMEDGSSSSANVSVSSSESQKGHFQASGNRRIMT